MKSMRAFAIFKYYAIEVNMGSLGIDIYMKWNDIMPRVCLNIKRDKSLWNLHCFYVFLVIQLISYLQVLHPIDILLKPSIFLFPLLSLLAQWEFVVSFSELWSLDYGAVIDEILGCFYMQKLFHLSCHIGVVKSEGFHG